MPIIHDSYTNGHSLLEAGVGVPFGRTGKQALQMYASVESAIAELSNVLPLPKPKTSDVRHQHSVEAVQKYGIGNCGCAAFRDGWPLAKRG